jgi:putative SOS response-associated peptidase YedK
MCGRFKLAPGEKGEVGSFFQVEDPRSLPARYNICPTQPIEIVRTNPFTDVREMCPVIWGLIPPWAKDTSICAKLINARADTAAEKPAFRNAFRRRRCIVPADGFYEWSKATKPRQPFLIRMRSGRLFGFAGLWEIWNGPNGEQLESCTILTTESNELVRPIHDRMPVILLPESYDQWLDIRIEESERLLPLLKPYPAEEMVATPVSTRINSPKVDDPMCIEQVSLPEASRAMRAGGYTPDLPFGEGS